LLSVFAFWRQVAELVGIEILCVESYRRYRKEFHEQPYKPGAPLVGANFRYAKYDIAFCQPGPETSTR